jgi:hypothetical protein
MNNMITVRIDDSTKKGKALLNFILTLDYVEVEKDDYELSIEDLKIIEERRENYTAGKGKTQSWEELKKKLGK